MSPWYPSYHHLYRYPYGYPGTGSISICENLDSDIGTVRYGSRVPHSKYRYQYKYQCTGYKVSPE